MDLRLEIAGSIPASALSSATLGCCSRLCHQAAWYRSKLGGKQAHYAMHWPRVHGLATSAGAWFSAVGSAISAAP